MLKTCLIKLHSLCYFMITDYIYIGFSLLSGDGEALLPLAINLLISPHLEKCPPVDSPPTKFLSPPSPPPTLPRQKNVSSPLTKQQFSSYNPIKTAFLAVVLLLLHFSFNFILFGHTGYVNFDFQLMFSIHRKQFLALKKVRIVKITPPQVPFAR